MKVVLSIDPIKFPLTGVGRYTYELAKGLQRSQLDDLLFLSGTNLKTTIPEVYISDSVGKMHVWKSYAQKNHLATSVYRILNPWLKGRALKDLGGYVFHSPNYYLPPFSGTSVVTIHDISTYLYPEFHPPERVRYMQSEIKIALKRATAIITDTEYTRQEVARFFNWPLERVYAVHLASSSEFKPRTNQDLYSVLSQYGLLPKSYTLFTGTIEPRKNIRVLLDAYEQLPLSIRTRYPLVIVGYKGWSSHDLHDRLESSQRAGWLRYLGFVPNNDLPFLMAGARLFSYPSLYEGFGLPILEAMASGVPVVCSDASSLPEVAGEAALFHNPNDTYGLLQLLKQGLEDEAWRSVAVDLGLKQASSFSWDRCSTETLAVYKNIKSL